MIDKMMRLNGGNRTFDSKNNSFIYDVTDIDMNDLENALERHCSMKVISFLFAPNFQLILHTKGGKFAPRYQTTNV